MLAALHRVSHDVRFRAQLSRDPQEALRDYNLTEVERTAVAGGDVMTIESYTGRLDERLRQWLLAERAG
jgi:hypothetical protein